MNCIVAVDENWSIGYKGGLLTYLPGDLKYVKDKTLGKVIVMGRKTLLSLPKQKPLKDRVNIVLTTDENFSCEDTVIYHSLEELNKGLKEYSTEDVFVFGGETVYRQLLSMCDKVYVTKIMGKYPADTSFPNLDELEEWEMSSISEKQEYPNVSYYWSVYEKTQ